MSDVKPTAEGRESCLFDITIIGGGPIGLFAAFYAGQRRMSTKIIDSLEDLGGQLTALYPEKYVFDIGGLPKILARDLARNLVNQAMQYQPTVVLGETVCGLDTITASAAHEPPEIHAAVAAGARVYKLTSNAGVHYTRTVLVAIGGGAFSPRKLALPEAAALENRGIYYTCTSKATFAEKRVLVVGGGDSAIDWSLNLGDVAAGHDGSGITLIHRRNQFRAHEESIRRLQATKSQILTFREIDGLIVENGVLKGVVLIHNQTKEKQTLEVDAILFQLGFSSSLGAIKNWPIKIEKGQIAVSSAMETAMPGIFAAGDVATYEGKFKLIATGFGEAVRAVNFAKTRVDPAAKAFPGHSSAATPESEHLVTV